MLGSLLFKHRDFSHHNQVEAVCNFALFRLLGEPQVQEWVWCVLTHEKVGTLRFLRRHDQVFFDSCATAVACVYLENVKMSQT